ncbi:MAG: hypothetical protein PSX36_00955 [bacterium]|nr:hypothetical protein [bacterium]
MKKEFKIVQPKPKGWLKKRLLAHCANDKTLSSFIVTLTVLLILFATPMFLRAQYGWTSLNQNGAIGTFTLSSAKITSVNTSGFLTSGYYPGASAANGKRDFIIQQIDAGTLNFNAANTWGHKYTIYDDVYCTTSARTYKCKGVYAIEATNPGYGEVYALAGVYDEGVFFATLDATGNIINTWRWFWIGNNGSILPPMITASQNVAGDYYICGSVNQQSYVMKINGGGGPTPVSWANMYSTNYWNEARALIESPYNANELIVVGRADDPSGVAKGMFMSIDEVTGNVNNLNTYGFNNGTHADDWFNAIELATMPNGANPGYIIWWQGLRS